MTRRSNRLTIRTMMIERCFAYRISRVLERVEGVGAATYLEVRKVLGQSR